MKLNSVLTSVLTKLGVDVNLAEVQTLLGNKALETIDVPELLSNKLSSDFFTKESALQNPEIRGKIRAESLNGVDALIEELSTKYSLDEETKAAIVGEDKTSKRYAKLVDTIAELEQKKSKTTGKNQDSLNLKITELNDQILKTRTDYEAKINEVERLRKSDRIGWELDGIYNELDYALPMDKQDAAYVAKGYIAKIASEKGLTFETSAEGIKLLTKEGTEYFENNIKIDPRNYIRKTLAEKKMLKVSDLKASTPERQRATSTDNRAIQISGSSVDILDKAIAQFQK